MILHYIPCFCLLLLLLLLLLRNMILLNMTHYCRRDDDVFMRQTEHGEAGYCKRNNRKPGTDSLQVNTHAK